MSYFKIFLVFVLLSTATASWSMPTSLHSSFEVQFRVVESCRIERQAAQVFTECTGVAPQVEFLRRSTGQSSPVEEVQGSQVVVYF